VAEGHDMANKVATVEDSAASAMHEQDIIACTQLGQWVREWYCICLSADLRADNHAACAVVRTLLTNFPSSLAHA
jgi:hypothetical protein